MDVINKFDIKVLRDYESRGLLRSQKHKSLPLIIWNYTNNCQYERNWDEITLACRGLVTDISGKVVSRPLSKFFNRNEGMHNETKDFIAYEKLDGWLGTFFNYHDKWVFTTRGSFDNDVCKWFEHVVRLKYLEPLLYLDPSYTYIFELISPATRIVADYENMEDVFLLAAINISTGEEMDILGIDGFKRTSIVEVDSLDAFQKLADENREGIVIVFDNGDRCKIKLEEYFRLSSIMSGCTDRNIWEILRTDSDMGTLLDNVPDEFRTWAENKAIELREEYDRIFHVMNDVYTAYIKMSGYDKLKLAENIECLAPFDRSMVMAFADMKYNMVKDNIWAEMKPAPNLYAIT